MAKWKFKQIDPQPARGTMSDDLWTEPGYVAEEKYDGDRRIAQFCGNVVRFTGRRKSVKDGLFVEKTENVPHLSQCGKTAALARVGGVPLHPAAPALDGTVLDGEMISHLDPSLPDGNALAFGGLSKYVTSIMGSLPEEAVKKQIERGWLRYVVFDCLYYKGEDIREGTLAYRRGAAAAALKEWGNPFATLAQQTDMEDKRAFYREVVNRGGEGIILKDRGHRYGDKQGWVKVKKQATADVVIMGFKPAKEMSKKVNGDLSMTKYAKAGFIGAIICGQYVLDESAGMTRPALAEVATVSGMTDDQRRDFTKNQRYYVGQVIEIEHNGREPTGRFRHPRFNRFRDDKAAKACVYREGET